MPFVGLADHHARSLLHRVRLSPLKHRRHYHHIVNGITAVLQLHLIRKIHSRSGGTCVGQKIPCLHIVGAEGAVSPKVTLDHGHIVVLPQTAQLVLWKVEGHLPVFHLEQLYSHLPQTDDKVVCRGISAVKGFSVSRHIRRLAVRPLIVSLGRGSHPLHGP